MAGVKQTFFRLSRNFFLSQSHRTISLSSVSNLKEIIEEKQGKTLTIEGKIVSDPSEGRLVKDVGNGSCLLCSAGIDIKHTDVLILSQFLRSNGCMLPRRITGLCRTQQKRISTMVTMAQKAGLMSNINPPNSKKDPKLRYGVKKFNVYYDEDTIKHKFYGVQFRQ